MSYVNEDGEGFFVNRPVSMNGRTNLLQIEEHMYILDDVQKPNGFRNMFPYSEIPKIPFNDRIVPHDMPKDIFITDTTFRDGQQSRAPYTTEQIVTIYDYLHRLGGPNGMIRASEFFLSRVGGYWVKFLATAGIIVLVYIMRKVILLSSDSTIEEKCISNIVMYCALFSLTFLPFYFWRSDFARLLRNFFPAFHILLIIFLKKKSITFSGQGKRTVIQKYITSKPLVLAVYFMLNIYMFYWDIYLFKDIVIEPLFTFNSVFDFMNDLFQKVSIINKIAGIQ